MVGLSSTVTKNISKMTPVEDSGIPAGIFSTGDFGIPAEKFIFCQNFHGKKIGKATSSTGGERIKNGKAHCPILLKISQSGIQMCQNLVILLNRC